jgi:hypothetical protein
MPGAVLFRPVGAEEGLRQDAAATVPGVEGEGAVEAVVAELLEHLGGPAGGAGDREDRGEEIGRDAERVIDRGRVEIDVGVEALALAS